MAYPAVMLSTSLLRPFSFAVPLCALLLAGAPALAGGCAQARLVHCGPDTCLRLSGERAQPTVAVRVDGKDLAVEGGRQWRLTVPLATARHWVMPQDDTLTLVLYDPRASRERVEHVALPPGALGRRVELASLIVSAL